MKKILNIVSLILIIMFFGSTYKYYSSNKNIEEKYHNRKNINEIINTKISNLPILKNNTDNVIEFNDGFSTNIKEDNPRSFWNLIKPE